MRNRYKGLGKGIGIGKEAQRIWLGVKENLMKKVEINQ